MKYIRLIEITPKEEALTMQGLLSYAQKLDLEIYIPFEEAPACYSWQRIDDEIIQSTIISGKDHLYHASSTMPFQLLTMEERSYLLSSKNSIWIREQDIEKVQKSRKNTDKALSENTENEILKLIVYTLANELIGLAPLSRLVKEEKNIKHLHIGRVADKCIDLVTKDQSVPEVPYRFNKRSIESTLSKSLKKFE